MTLFDSILDRSAVNNTTLFRVQPKTTDATQQPFASEDSARQLNTENTPTHEGPVEDARIQKNKKRKRNELSKEEQNKAPKITINSADTGIIALEQSTLQGHTALSITLDDLHSVFPMRADEMKSPLLQA